MTKTAEQEIQVGDVVRWRRLDKNYKSYTPPPPYVVVSIDPEDNNLFMQTVDGEVIFFGEYRERHRGVAPRSVVKDNFLTAAYKACHSK